MYVLTGVTFSGWKLASKRVTTGAAPGPVLELRNCWYVRLGGVAEKTLTAMFPATRQCHTVHYHCHPDGCTTPSTPLQSDGQSRSIFEQSWVGLCE